MEESELLEIAARGEDSTNQFKRDVNNANSLAAEMVAFANSGGGHIYIGIEDDGTFRALTVQRVGELNQLISNAASDSVRPSVNTTNENVSVGDGIVMVVSVPDGLNKPYTDASGQIWVKSGSDKRKVTAREELQRMFQTAQLIHGDNQPVSGSSLADLDQNYFASFYEKRFKQSLDDQEISLQQLLTNMRQLRDSRLTVTSVLLFGSNPHSLLPAFHIKAIAYPGTEIDTDRYLDSADFTGKLQEQFDDCMGFFKRNLRSVQDDGGVNDHGVFEIPQIVLEELLANALIHRDFLVSAPIRVFVFKDRVEIVSPGHLPNNLTVENILSGNSNMRNPTLASFATRLLPYRGLGTGIIRARLEYPSIEFIDDRDGNKFVAKIHRPSS